MVSTRRKESGKQRENKGGLKSEGASTAEAVLTTKGARSRSAISSLFGKATVTPENSADAMSEDASSSAQQSSIAEKATKKVGRKQKTVKIVVPVKPAVVKRKGGRVKEKGGYRGGRKPAAQAVPKPAPAAKKTVVETAIVATTAAAASTANALKKASPRTGARAGTRSSHGLNGSSELFTGIDDINRFPPSVAAQKKKLLMQNKKKEQRQLRYMAVGDETTTVNKFGETVVKVKLLTGTLYIYKGNPEGTAKRRAEFVRSK